MPVTPNALLEAAKVLGRGEAEVDRRNAASRAYYAAWHQCLPIGRSVGLSARRARGYISNSSERSPGIGT